MADIQLVKQSDIATVATSGSYADLANKPTIPTQTSQLTNNSGFLTTVSSTTISDASTVGKSVLTAADAPTARTALGAGTSNLALGTTGTTALAGNGTAVAATKLATARTITLTGPVTGSASFDGSANASVGTTLAAATSSTIGGVKIPTALHHTAATDITTLTTDYNALVDLLATAFGITVS